VRNLPPRKADLLLAVAYLLECNIELTFVDASSGTVFAFRAFTVAMACGVAVRRRAPLVAAGLVFAGLVAMERVGGEQQATLIGPWLAAFIVSYTIGAELQGRRLGVGVAWLAALVAALAFADPTADSQGLNLVWGWLVIVAAPVLAGRLLHERARVARALHAAASDDGRDAWAVEAVAEERERIAAELHDVVARALERMVREADHAAELVVAQPAFAALSFSAVEQTGRDALAEIRRLLGVLRHEDDELALAPQPTLAHVADLVRRAEGAGLAVTLKLEGHPVALAAGADLTAFRVVQEALAGAVRDGGAGSASVRVRYSGDVVELKVLDDGAPRPTPPGIAERVALYGGELRTARPRAGGFAVLARLPVGGAA
jgi:signal transduction histidine kinase